MIDKLDTGGGGRGPGRQRRSPGCNANNKNLTQRCGEEKQRKPGMAPQNNGPVLLLQLAVLRKYIPAGCWDLSEKTIEIEIIFKKELKGVKGVDKRMGLQVSKMRAGPKL